MTNPENRNTDFQKFTAQPRNRIHYYPIVLKGSKFGYLYVDSTEARASLILILEALDIDSRMEAVAVWDDRLNAGEAQGLSPLEILEHWKGAPEHPLAGSVPKDAELRECATYEDLEQLANPGYTPPPGPDPQGSPYHRQRAYDWGPLVSKNTGPVFPMFAKGPVRWRPVWLGDTVIGLLWASEEENAFACVPRTETLGDGYTARGWWHREGAEMLRRGLTATEALRARVGLEEDPKGGRLDEADPERVAPSLEELETIAYGPWPP